MKKARYKQRKSVVLWIGATYMCRKTKFSCNLLQNNENGRLLNNGHAHKRLAYVPAMINGYVI